eukprot:4570958-Prorocentrum_lima.AAC.1
MILNGVVDGDGMSPRMQVDVVEYFQRVHGSQERFRHEAELAWMTSRHGEQQALINCERAEQ